MALPTLTAGTMGNHRKTADTRSVDKRRRDKIFSGPGAMSRADIKDAK
jgi:hypothetical protein